MAKLNYGGQSLYYIQISKRIKPNYKYEDKAIRFGKINAGIANKSVIFPFQMYHFTNPPLYKNYINGRIY